MIKKILIFNQNDLNQFISTLVEGFKLNGGVKLFSTSKVSYCSDIVINSKRTYDISTSAVEDAPPYPMMISKIIDEDEYVEECEDLIEECDLIIIVDDNYTLSSAHFKNKDGCLITHLHEYAISNYKNKIAFLDTGSTYFINGNYTMYGNYLGGHPSHCGVYFKREKSLELEWEDNVVPFPRASEERYFTGGKDFNNIWCNKVLDVGSMFRTGGHPVRGDIKTLLYNHYGDNKKCNINNVFDKIDNTDRKIDKEIYGVENDDLVGSIRHHYSYYEVLLRTKINIECPQYQGWGFHTQRMMESLANGCCYFYPPPSYNVDFPNGLINGEDFIIYHSPDDLIKKIEYYLSHEEEMRTIAENGFNKLLKYHTSEVRAKEFLETCERYMG